MLSSITSNLFLISELIYFADVLLIFYFFFKAFCNKKKSFCEGLNLHSEPGVVLRSSSSSRKVDLVPATTPAPFKCIIVR